MNKKFKELTIKLSHLLKLTTYRFLSDNLHEEENTSDILNLMLSSHVNSISDSMIRISENNENIKKEAQKFIGALYQFLSSIHPIESMERISNDFSMEEIK